MTPTALLSALAAVPRFRFAALPTPLERAPGLSRALGLDILVKRDDLTGVALGGNKARKLEYLVGDALAERATLLLATAAAQSNFCRMTAAAGCRAGLRVGLLLRGTPDAPVQGNLLLDRLLGAELRFVSDLDPYALVHHERLQAWAEEERARGGRPYPIYLHEGSRAGALVTIGYVAAAGELGAQCTGLGVRPDHLYLAVGSGSTLAGLLLGARRPDNPLAGTRIVGVSIGASAATVEPKIREFVASAAALLRIPEPPEGPLLDDSQRGTGYGVPTGTGLAAIRLAARTEALLLNPVYTGKAFAALCADVERGIVRPGESVVFLNTGGDPLLFSYATTLAADGRLIGAGQPTDGPAP